SSAAALATTTLLGGHSRPSVAADGALRFGPPHPYDFAALVERARELAAAPYQAPVEVAPDLLDQIDFDAHQKIQFRPEATLWGEAGAAFSIRFFHLGRYQRLPVRIYEVAEGHAREILYSAAA